ncbi:MAG: hypothetical protein ABIO45_08420 [Burkholderiaceae bacterium]
MAAGRNKHGQTKVDAAPSAPTGVAAGSAVAVDARAAPASPEALRFATLTTEVERARAALAHWQSQLAAFDQAYARSVAPLWRRLHALRSTAAQALERQLDTPEWNRAEEAALRELLRERIAQLRRDAGDEIEAGLVDLLGRHAAAASALARDTDEQAPASIEADSADADGFDCDEADLERRREQREADAKARLQTRRARRLADAAVAADTDAEPAGRSLREVFRRLASALHPDREIDPARRSAKSALMQQANRAHGEKDLLALLELQRQIGSAGVAGDASASASASANAQRLAHYNRLLAEQAAGMKVEIDRLEAAFRNDIGLPVGRGLNPAKLVAYAKQDARQLREALAAMESEVRLFIDTAALRAWLRNGRQRRRERHF